MLAFEYVDAYTWVSMRVCECVGTSLCLFKHVYVNDNLIKIKYNSYFNCYIYITKVNFSNAYTYKTLKIY